MRIRRYIPSFMDQSGPVEFAHFHSKKELLAIPWVKHFSQDPDFDRYSLAKETLIAEYKESSTEPAHPLVIGFIEGQRPYQGPCVDLPEFVTERKRV